MADYRIRTDLALEARESISESDCELRGVRVEEYYKEKYPEEYDKFLKYEKELKKRTPNIKQIYFDYLDGKIEHPGWEYFTPEGMDLD